ncbi:DNA methylase N-4/N-6 domain-containing protein [Caballeronia novacaledonica]|uniref:site-specific DNA-methyltransferase (adenine-specific) n=1 Tax=Caballeronia novacaledonica TaxID=1544861 RepID=A0A2U3IEA4_9BURK|nr:site-specific DNA-methyltransferase [Caballeronia novacaledonica]SPB18547.1 DNA methylase N-4/N-6 domain-containing protein [Caballeronia novacaledonica]
MELVQRSLADLVPYERNARAHSPAQIDLLVASLREFGFTNPVLIDDRNRVIAGHGRLLAAQAIGMAEVPCVVLSHLTEVQRRAYILADNQLAERAGWDRELLALELGALRDDGFDLALTGFESKDLERLIGPEGLPGLTGEDNAPPCPDAPVSERGDVWLCGPHRVMCGDALDAADMARLMGNSTAALVLTDPPYNVDYEGKGRQRLKIVNDAMAGAAFHEFLLSAFTAMLAHATPGAPAYVFHADTEGLNFRRAFADAGWRLAEVGVWVKPAFVLGHHDYHWRHEPIIYGWKPGAAHRWYGDRSQSTVWTFDRPTRSDDHPTMKPVALLAYLTMNSSEVGDIVLDPFGGSGSTMIACAQLGRVARLMEIDPRYCDVVVRRWQDFSGERASRESDGAWFEELVSSSALSEARVVDHAPTTR